MGYFKGNTRARRLRMAKTHAKFLKHQRAWMMRAMVRHFAKAKGK